MEDLLNYYFVKCPHCRAVSEVSFYEGYAPFYCPSCEKGFQYDRSKGIRKAEKLVPYYFSLWGAIVLAPFWIFLHSEFELTYEWIDNEMAPQEIRLVSSAKNSFWGKPIRTVDFSILLNEKGQDEEIVFGDMSLRFN